MHSLEDIKDTLSCTFILIHCEHFLIHMKNLVLCND